MRSPLHLLLLRVHTTHSYTPPATNNQQFNELMKILSIKYGVFSNTPPEIQMSIIVISTAYLTIMNNRKEKELLEEHLKGNKI